MNKSALYERLISNSRLRGDNKKNLGYYTERHHILPRCMGGDNSPDNLVLMTPKEHYLAHKLLCKIYPDNYKLAHAFWNMTTTASNNRDYNVSSNNYKLARELHSKSLKNNWKDPEFKIKTGQAISKSLNIPEVREKRNKSIRKALSKKSSKAKLSAASIKYHSSYGVKEKYRDNAVLSWKDPVIRKNRCDSIRKKLATIETKTKQRKASKLTNSDPAIKSKIIESCKKAKQTSPIWFSPLREEIFEMWKSLNCPGYVTFRKIMVSKNYPDVNYNALINKYFKKAKL